MIGLAAINSWQLHNFILYEVTKIITTKYAKIYLVSAIIACITISCNKPASFNLAAAKHVDVQLAIMHNVPYIYDYPAAVEGVIDFPVIPRVSGTINKQIYKEGSFVKKDQPLYQIDPRPFLLDMQSANGLLIKDQSALENYTSIYNRYQALLAAEAVSQQDLEQATINYKGALGQVQSDRAAIEQAKLNLEYAVVKSPADGYIAERQVSVGDTVVADQTVMNHVNSRDDMYVSFAMPENDRLSMQAALAQHLIQIPKNYKFTVDIKLADGTIITDAGYVDFVNTRIDNSNGVWTLRALIDNKKLHGLLLSGQFVHIYLKGVLYKNSFTVPQEAVFRDDAGAYVYLAIGGGAAHNTTKVVKQYITTGLMTNNSWIVTAGLKNNMPIITLGGVKIMAGDTVIVDNSAAE